MVNVEGINKLLRQSKGEEIRMGLADASGISLDLDDKSIVDLFKNGIAIDVVIKKANVSDRLPKRLEICIQDPEQC